eukprot:6476954-Karenia_brevis.AAC.1
MQKLEAPPYNTWSLEPSHQTTYADTCISKEGHADGSRARHATQKKNASTSKRQRLEIERIPKDSLCQAHAYPRGPTLLLWHGQTCQPKAEAETSNMQHLDAESTPAGNLSGHMHI